MGRTSQQRRKDMMMILFLASLITACVGQAQGSCLKPNITWLSDILDSNHPIDTPYLRQALCVDTDGCAAFTWTSDNAHLKLHCFLFVSTYNQTSCTDCVSGPASCTCSEEVECIGDVTNIVDELEGVPTEAECQTLCLDTESCSTYTWHSSNSFPPLYCVLLSSCEGTGPCHDCYSGSPECFSQIPTTTPAPVEEGILITGGNGARTSAEVFTVSGGQSCVLPSLPDQRWGHTSNSLTMCGGASTSTSCISFSSGVWVPSHSLAEKRKYHTTWQREEGLLLLGGKSSSTTTELFTEGSEEGVPAFSLQYSTVYACSIPELTSDTLVITGGRDSMTAVSRYGADGFLGELPPLNEGRRSHGCGVFLGQDGGQVLLVAGGHDGYSLSSTEVLASDSTSWEIATPLPRVLVGLRGVTAGGVLYMTGGYNGGDSRAEVLAWEGDLLL